MISSRRIFTVLLRLLALAATLVATIVMVTSKGSTNVFNLTFEAKFSNSPAFKYFVVVQTLACAYSFVIMCLASRGSVWHLVIILDVVVAVLLASSLSSALAIAAVGKKVTHTLVGFRLVDKFQSFASMLLLHMFLASLQQSCIFFLFFIPSTVFSVLCLL